MGTFFPGAEPTSIQASEPVEAMRGSEEQFMGSVCVCVVGFNGAAINTTTNTVPFCPITVAGAISDAIQSNEHQWSVHFEGPPRTTQ